MIGRVVSFCDLTGNMVRPWAEAGYECWCVDVQHSIRRDRREVVGNGSINFVWGDVRSWAPPQHVRFDFFIAQTPCTHVAVSGARDFEKKRGFMVRDALELFESSRQAAMWHGCPFMMENPVGVFGSYAHIGKPNHYFHPSDYTGWCADDNYTKRTCIWSGGALSCRRSSRTARSGRRTTAFTWLHRPVTAATSAAPRRSVSPAQSSPRTIRL